MMCSNDTDRAWAAGLWDGEGCASLNTMHRPSGEYVYCYSSMGQVDRRVLDRLTEVTGIGKVYGPYARGGHPITMWRAAGYLKMLALARFLWPYLGQVKRDQFKRTLTGHLAARVPHVLPSVRKP
jgi:hypothetical protein